jgi:hypothetical protein
MEHRNQHEKIGMGSNVHRCFAREESVRGHAHWATVFAVRSTPIFYVMVTTFEIQELWLTLNSNRSTDCFPQVVTHCRNLIAGAGGLESFAVQEWLRLTIKTDTPRLDLLSSAAAPSLILFLLAFCLDDANN